MDEPVSEIPHVNSRFYAMCLHPEIRWRAVGEKHSGGKTEYQLRLGTALLVTATSALHHRSPAKLLASTPRGQLLERCFCQTVGPPRRSVKLQARSKQYAAYSKALLLLGTWERSTNISLHAWFVWDSYPFKHLSPGYVTQLNQAAVDVLIPIGFNIASTSVFWVRTYLNFFHLTPS